MAQEHLQKIDVTGKGHMMEVVTEDFSKVEAFLTANEPGLFLIHYHTQERAYHFLYKNHESGKIQNVAAAPNEFPNIISQAKNKRHLKGAVKNSEIAAWLEQQKPEAKELLSQSSIPATSPATMEESENLQERIRADFPDHKFSPLEKALLLPLNIIHQQLKVWSKLPKRIKNRYSFDDPALFQKEFSGQSLASLAKVDVIDYLQKAARVGNLDLVKFLIIKGGVDHNSLTLMNALESGNLELVKYVLEAIVAKQPHQSFDDTILDSAAKSGSVELVDALLERKLAALPLLTIGLNTPNSAALSGSVELVEFLMSKGMKLDSYMLHRAAYAGSLPLVTFLIGKGIAADKLTLDNAAESGNLELVRSLITEDLQPDQETLNHAAKSGNVELVKLLAQKGLKPEQETLNQAALSGSLVLVEWLLVTYPTKPDQNTLNNAVRSSSLALVQALFAKRLQPDEQTLQYAVVEAVNLSLIKWLVSPERGKQRARLGFHTLHYAEQSGNPELRKYLEQQFAPSSPQAIADSKDQKAGAGKDAKQEAGQEANAESEKLAELPFSKLPSALRSFLEGSITKVERELQKKTAQQYWDEPLDAGVGAKLLEAAQKAAKAKAKAKDAGLSVKEVEAEGASSGVQRGVEREMLSMKLAIRLELVKEFLKTKKNSLASSAIPKFDSKDFLRPNIKHPEFENICDLAAKCIKAGPQSEKEKALLSALKSRDAKAVGAALKTSVNPNTNYSLLPLVGSGQRLGFEMLLGVSEEVFHKASSTTVVIPGIAPGKTSISALELAELAGSEAVLKALQTAGAKHAPESSASGLKNAIFRPVASTVAPKSAHFPPAPKPSAGPSAAQQLAIATQDATDIPEDDEGERVDLYAAGIPEEDEGERVELS